MIDLDHPLVLESVGHRFGGTVALDDISLSVRPGTVHALLGPNGAGKSTTISASVGLLTPRFGSVRLFGLDPVRDHTITGSLTGVMLQDGGLPTSAKPLQVLGHLAKLYREPADYRTLAARLGIDSFASRSIRRLSGGQKQRVALAAALMGRPRLVFLDEPTAGLDPQAMLVVYEVIEELRADGVAVVLTTHDMDDAERLADDVTIIDHGRIIAAGPPTELAGPGDSSLRMTLSRPLPHAVAQHLTVWGEVEIRGLDVVISGRFGTREISGLMRLLEANEVSVRELRCAPRSLGDVFLDLTGRSLR